MKGFVSVTKASLLEMISNCREAIEADLSDKLSDRIDLYIDTEKKRITTRRWYRLFILPKARFEFNNISVREYSAGRYYEIFDGCPLEMLVKDALNSNKWLDSFGLLAQSNYAEEPIQIDANTFLRLSNPYDYHWATVGMHYSVGYVW